MSKKATKFNFPVNPTKTTNPKFVNSRNEPLEKERDNGGIPKYSKVQMRKKLKLGKYYVRVKEGKLIKPKKIEKPQKTLKQKLYGRKKVQTTLQPKLDRYVPSVYKRRPKRHTKSFDFPTRLRKSLTPGTVCIVLSGRYAGKRVVYLKQLKTGLCVVTGPFKLNGVPLRRINQCYLIATTTKVDFSGVSVPSDVDDKFFTRDVVKSEKKRRRRFL